MKPVHGFTLLEMMVVVTIIAVIAMIALPMFTEQLRKGKRSEAIQALSDVQLREEKWRSYNTKYASTASVFGSAGAVTAYNNGLKYYTISIVANSNTDTAYNILATRKGSMASDPKCGNFTLNYSAGTATKGVSIGNADYCWRRK